MKDTLRLYTNGGTFHVSKYDHDWYKGIDIEFITSKCTGMYARVLIDYNKDDPRYIQLQAWQDPSDEDSTVDITMVEYPSWQLVKKDSSLKMDMNQIMVNVPGGQLEATIDDDGEYPAIEIQFISNNGIIYENSLVRVRFEYSESEGLRLFVFDDPEEDFKNVYYFDTDKQRKINLGYEMIEYIQEFTNDMTDIIGVFSNLGFSFKECNQLVTGDFVNDYTVLHSFDKLLNEILELVHDTEESKKVLKHLGFTDEEIRKALL